MNLQARSRLNYAPRVIIFILALAVLLGGGLLAQEATPAESPGIDGGKVSELVSKLKTKLGGSVALSWAGVEPSRTALAAPSFPGGPRPRTNPEEGFMGEFAIFATITASDQVKANFRACYGCHGLELEYAYLSFDPHKNISIRAGRIGLPVGGISGKHDQAMRQTISKPLPQAMGNMIRGREFNQGVLPAPASENGFWINTGTDVGDFRVSADFFVTSGLKGFSPDVNFITTRDFEDNNGEPAVGARIEAASDTITVGAAGLTGHYDQEARLRYEIVTVDLGLKFGNFKIDAHGAQRRTAYIDGGGVENHYWKRGYWVQASQKLSGDFTVAVAADGLFVSGIALGANGPTIVPALALTDTSNQLHRVMAGVVWSPAAHVQIKGSIEYWDFSDFEDGIMYQFALVFSF